MLTYGYSDNKSLAVVWPRHCTRFSQQVSASPPTRPDVHRRFAGRIYFVAYEAAPHGPPAQKYTLFSRGGDAGRAGAPRLSAPFPGVRGRNRSIPRRQPTGIPRRGGAGRPEAPPAAG